MPVFGYLLFANVSWQFLGIGCKRELLYPQVAWLTLWRIKSLPAWSCNMADDLGSPNSWLFRNSDRPAWVRRSCAWVKIQRLPWKGFTEFFTEIYRSFVVITVHRNGKMHVNKAHKPTRSTFLKRLKQQKCQKDVTHVIHPHLHLKTVHSSAKCWPWKHDARIID